MTLASVNTFLEMSGADREAGDIVSAAGIDKSSDPTKEQGFGRAAVDVDVTKLREDLLLQLERERSEEVAGLRSKQKQIIGEKKGRQAELMELQKAEESHRDLLLKGRDERNNIAKDLHLLRRGHLVDMEEETRRELASLQREKELLLAKEKQNEDAIDEVRRQIMEQDEVYHHAMDAAGKNIRNWKRGVDKDGRQLDSAARSQRQAIQSERVALAEMFGKKAGTLRQEQVRLQHELHDVNGRIQKARKDGVVSPKGAEDALASLMSEAGMEEQAARLRRLKSEFEQQHAEDVAGGFIKEYEGAEAKTRKALKHRGKLLEGRTGEYAEATADEFLEDWLKTDADRARDAAVASATAATSAAPPGAAGTLSSRGPGHDSANHPGGDGPTNPVSGRYGGTDRRSSATHHKNGTHTTHKKRRSSQDHDHGNEHLFHGHHQPHPDYNRRHGGGDRNAHDSGRGRSCHNPARAERTSSSESEGSRSLHARHGGDDHKSSPHRRRNAAAGLVSPVTDVSRTPHADSQEPAAERHHRRYRSEKGLAPLEVLSRDKSNRISSAAEHKTGKITEAMEGSGSLNARPQTQTGSKPPNHPEDDAEDQGGLRRANDDTAQLRETVELLKSELDSLKAGKAGAGLGVGGMAGVPGGGLGSNGTNSGFLFGGAATPVGGPPWQAAPGLPQYIASLDAENARMVAEIQGLSTGGASAGNFGVAGVGSDLNMGSSSLLAGSGAVAGRGAVRYLGPGLHGNQSGKDGGVTGAEQDAGDGVSSAVDQKQGGPARKTEVGAEWDSAVLGGGEYGEPLSPRNREYRRKMIEMDAEHKEAVKRLEFEMQRLELEQQLEDMRERMAREKKTRQQDVAHEQWVTEQKRNLQAIKIEKTLARERQLMEVQQTLNGARGGGGGGGGRYPGGLGGVTTTMLAAGGWRPGVGGIMQRPYNKDHGFCVFWDYLTGLPKRSGSKVIGKVRLAFGLYTGKRLHGKMLATPWTEIAPRAIMNENTGKAETFSKLETRSTFTGIPLHVQTKLVVELQFKDEAGVHGKGRKGNLGWGCIYVFKPEKGNAHRLTVRAGLAKLTLFPGSVDLRIANVNDDKSAVSRSTPTAAFIRLVHGEDTNPAGAFVVDPDTQHLYAAYGRGNIPQLERQKLMTGTFLWSIFALGKLKRSLVSSKRVRAPGGESAEEPSPLQRGSSRRDSIKLQRVGAYTSVTAPQKSEADDIADGSGGKTGGTEGEGEEAKPTRSEKKAPTPENEKPAESSDSEERDSVEEEDSEDDDESTGNGRNGPAGRRRSSLMSLQSQLAGQKTMARRASLSQRRRSTMSRLPFLKGDGFDLYVDRGCGLPHSCTVSKVFVRVIGDVGDEGDCSEICHADSPSNNPVFGLRHEFRTGPEGRMDMTSTLMIRVDTLDRFSSEHRAVGYALVAIFMDPSGNQPTNAKAEGAFLREGNYQVPLYQKPPPDMRRVTSKSLDKCPRVPCASVLVRVKPASKTPAGKTLSRADVPEEEWRKFGLAPPIPEFAPGVYDNSYLPLTDLERHILELRSKDRNQEIVGETGTLIKSPDNPAPVYESDADCDEFEEWANSKMSKKPAKMVEYHRVEKYRPDEGFSVAVAGLINMKNPGAFKPPRLYKVIFSLSMPGLFYLGDPPAADQAEFTHSYEPCSSQTAPRFRDPPHVFRHQAINNNQSIVLDVRFLKVDGKELAAVPEDSSIAPACGAWGLLPAFSAGDMATGSFMVPLLSGPVPPEVLKAESPIQFMTEKVKAKHPSFRVLEGSSVVVQICNALLPGVLPPATQDPKLNYICVKRITDALGMQQEKYAFDYVSDGGQKAVGRIVPKSFKGRQDDFFTAVNIRFAKITGMTYVARPAELPKGRA
eukprot:g13222.t1